MSPALPTLTPSNMGNQRLTQLFMRRADSSTTNFGELYPCPQTPDTSQPCPHLFPQTPDKSALASSGIKGHFVFKNG